jgi:hypothetical protein
VLIVGVLTGPAPALQSGRADLTEALKSGAREGTYQRSKVRTGLLLLQGALSVVLPVGAGLFVRSLNNVYGLRLGFDAEQLLWVGVEERGESLTNGERGALRDRLAETARGLPGVANAARAVTVPFMMTWNENIVVAGHDTDETESPVVAHSGRFSRVPNDDGHTTVTWARHRALRHGEVTAGHGGQPVDAHLPVAWR